MLHFEYILIQYSSIPVLHHESTEISSDQEKADVIKKFFSSCFNQSIPPIVPLDSNQIYTPCPDLLCTVAEVAEMLSSLDTTKSSGPDGISSKMFKMTDVDSAIAPSITALFNLSISCN